MLGELEYVLWYIKTCSLVNFILKQRGDLIAIIYALRMKAISLPWVQPSLPSCASLVMCHV